MADKKYFVVLVDGDAPVAQRDAFMSYLRERRGAGFWHHVSHGWLVSNSAGDLTASALRDKLHELMPAIVHVVLEVSPVTWSGFFKKPAGEWLRNYWN